MNNDELTQNHIEQSIIKAHEYSSKLSENPLGIEILQLLGFTSPKVKHLLNNLCNFSDCSYLELGTWIGSTFCSSIYDNDISAIGIDKFQDSWSTGQQTILCPITYDPAHWTSLVGNVPIVDQCISNVKKYKQNNKNVALFKTDLYDFDFDVIKKPINCFFLDCDQMTGDAPDEYFHFNVIHHFKNIFADKFIFIKDDWNWTRHSTRLGLEKLENYKITYDIELFTKKEEDITDWWNGIYIALLEKI